MAQSLRLFPRLSPALPPPGASPALPLWLSPALPLPDASSAQPCPTSPRCVPRYTFGFYHEAALCNHQARLVNGWQDGSTGRYREQPFDANLFFTPRFACPTHHPPSRRWL